MSFKDWFKKHTGEDVGEAVADLITNPVGELVELLIKCAAGELKQQMRKKALAAKIPGLTPEMVDKLLPLLVAEVEKFVKAKAKV